MTGWSERLAAWRRRAQDGCKLLAQWTRELGGRSAEALERMRARLVRMTLGTRLFLVLVSMASATGLIIVVLQNASLSSDLERAAQARLGRAASVADKILEEHVAAQFDRYRVQSATPQFIANLEARHGPTLSRFAEELARQNGARATLFVAASGEPIAGAGDEALGELAREHLDELEPDHEAPITSCLSLGGMGYSAVRVPLRSGAESMGALLALEAIEPAELEGWSELCGARVDVAAGAAATWLTETVRSMGELQLRVTTSYDDERRAMANARRNAIVGGLVGLVLASLVSLVLARSLVRPIRAIQAATARIADGELKFRLDESRSDEVGDVARGFNLMLERLDENIRERVRVEDKISHMAFHDSLTGLGNRRLLRDRLESALHRSSKEDTNVAVMFMDLDRFKDVNDALGHRAGDELLVEVARRIDGCLASEDAPGGGGEGPLLIRVGGDEFTVLLSDIEDPAEVEVFAERILDVLATPVKLRDQEVCVGASIGSALAPADTDEAETLLRYSDLAMYHAKNRGGSNHEFYADSMEAIASKRIVLEAKIQRALENGEFELYYQPKLDLTSGKVHSVEALLRWNDPELGLVSPDDFISVAEETGAIVPVGDWVLREAIDQSARWLEDGVPPVRIAINVSARQLEYGGDFASRLSELLEESGMDPSLLEVEITEGAMMRDEGSAIELLDRIRDEGVTLALDDFGTGYSSLSYLRRLPITTVKIDRSFIGGMDKNPEEASLVESIIDMAHTLNLRVVAEGVETRKHRRLLDEYGCDEIQGYQFCRPLPADEAAVFLRRRRRRRTPRKLKRKVGRKAA